MRKLSFLLILICLSCSRQGGNALSNTRIAKVIINNVEFVNDDGQAWDGDGSGPDIVISITPPGENQSAYSTEVKNNVKAAALPVSVPVAENLMLTKGQWMLKLYELDDEGRQQMDELTLDTKLLKGNSIELKSNKGKATTLSVILEELK